MPRKPFSEEEIALLSRSPYVLSVISGSIIFTPEFRKIMYDGLIRGKTVRTTLQEHGIDPNILGKRRLWGIAARLREHAGREEGFVDLRMHNTRKPASGTTEQALADRVKQLEHELAYTQQEVEFLKKIRLADLEAQQSWESKQRQK